MSILNYKLANNLSEYMDICKSTFFEETKSGAYSTNKTIPFEFDEWVDFFGAWELRQIEDDSDVKLAIRTFSGDIELKPDNSEYPVLVVFNFDEDEDRLGSVSSAIWDWTPLSGLIPNQKVDGETNGC